jgi:hypothetical protein
MISFLRTAVATLCLSGLAACTSVDATKAMERRQSDLASYPNLPALLEACRGAQKVEVFEGLPHPFWEPKLWGREERRKDVFWNHGFGFYVPALALSRQDRDRLLSSATRRATYFPWGGPKLCGGFHPDLLLRFHHSIGVIDVHLCFGCNEVIFYGLSSRSHVDLSEVAAHQWKEIQERNRTKRPPPEKWEEPAT